MTRSGSIRSRPNSSTCRRASLTHRSVGGVTDACLRLRLTLRAGDWALDLALTLKGDGIDWQRLVRDSIALHTQAWVGSALLFGREQLELAIPADAVGELVAATGKRELGELDYFHTHHPGSPGKHPIEARDLAVARAKAAYAREGRTPAVRTGRLTLDPPAVPATLEPRKNLDVKLPGPLQPSDRLELHVASSPAAGQGRAQFLVDSPAAPLAMWTEPRNRAGTQSRRVELAVPIPPELFIMGRGESVSIRPVGNGAITDIRVRWQSVSTLTRLRRRLGRLRRRLGAAFSR